MDKVEHHYREALRLNPRHPNARDNVEKFFPAGKNLGTGVAGQGRKKAGSKSKKKEKVGEGCSEERLAEEGPGKEKVGFGEGGKVKKDGGGKRKGRKVSDGVKGVRREKKRSEEKGSKRGAGSHGPSAGEKEGGDKKEGGGGGGMAGGGGGGGMATWGVEQYEEALSTGVCAGEVEKNCRNNLGVLLFQQVLSGWFRV